MSLNRHTIDLTMIVAKFIKRVITELSLLFYVRFKKQCSMNEIRRLNTYSSVTETAYVYRTCYTIYIANQSVE